MPVLLKGGAEVNVEHVESRTIHLNISSKATALFATGPGDVIVAIDLNWKPAQDHIAIIATVQPPCLAESEIKPQLLGEEPGLVLFTAAALDAQHFLKGDDVRIDLRQDIGNPSRTDAPVQTLAFMDVIGGYS